MWRIKVWSIAFSPMLIGLLIMIYIDDGIGQLIMYLGYFSILYATNIEKNILSEKGIDNENGSTTGNFLANILGVIFIAGAIWLFSKLAINIYTGNF